MQITIAPPPLVRCASSSIVTATVVALAFSLFACTETQVRSRRGRFNPENLPRPDPIVVYDFDTTPTEVILDPSIPAEIARGNTPLAEAWRRVALAVADVLAATLVDAILELGLPAERGYDAPFPKRGALIIDGQLVRIDEGDRTKRTTVGFGAGASELRTQLQVYQVTGGGRQLIAQFETVTEGTEQPFAGDAAVVDAGTDGTESADFNSTPREAAHALSGAVAADAERTAMRAAEVLSELFARQGWISEREE